MTFKQTHLARKNLEKRLAPLRSFDFLAPRHGWCRAIRNALCMSTRQLAIRMGVGRSRIVAIEKAEITGATTLKTLRQTAEAMNCTFVYGFVPRQPLELLMRDQAMRKVDHEFVRLNHTMQLEQQALTTDDLHDFRERMIDEQLAGSLRRLWDDQ